MTEKNLIPVELIRQIKDSYFASHTIFTGSHIESTIESVCLYMGGYLEEYLSKRYTFMPKTETPAPEPPAPKVVQIVAIPSGQIFGLFDNGDVRYVFPKG